MSKRNRIAFTLVLIAAFAVGGWWLAAQWAPHEHELVRMTDEEGRIYYTCSMHPQVRRDEPGNCPVCGMQLVKREDPSAATSAAEREVLYWYDPMRPDVQFDQPGKSPFMDMALVPKYADGGDEVTVQVDPGMLQNLGLRTAPVTRGTFWQRVDATARLEDDEYSLQAVTVRAAGWVERLHVRAEGDRVQRGQLLAEVYAPQLDSAQQEFLLALDTGEPGLIEAARARLAALGVSDRQTATLETTREPRRRVPVYAPMEGYVMKLSVREGAPVEPNLPLMELGSHARIWAVAEVPEAQSSWLRVGRPVEVTVPAHPGRTFEGQIDYLYPDIEQHTRTRRMRIVLDNPQELLHPGMYAQVALYGGALRDVLLVPSEAVIRTGRRNVVILAVDAGRFRPAEVRLGPERDNETVILAGVEEGQQVVTSGQFLIDSEASLLGAYQRMDGDPPAGRMRQLGVEGAPAVYGDRPGGHPSGAPDQRGERP